MSKKNGFTLVELMVVIVIIGVLTAVAIPKLMAAADRARAAEGPQTLGTAARLQHAYKVEAGKFTDDWEMLGFDTEPSSRWFTFSILPETDINDKFQIVATPSDVFNYQGTLWINNIDCRGAIKGTGTEKKNIGTIVPGWTCDKTGAACTGSLGICPRTV
jgi:prepilin-type N-terminal cleavage/methylation domain-containing protein